MSLRSRRMEEEWQLLEKLVCANPHVFAGINKSAEEFHVALKESPAWIQRGCKRQIETEHAVRYVYPHYYPTLPLEGYFVRPIAHINVDPITGFVCLWDRYRPAQTIVNAILITRAIMSWKTANRDPAHCMQPIEHTELPGMQPLMIPEDCRPMLLQSKRRQRLSSELDDQPSHESDCAFSYTE
jgi:ubiquitin-protein ligase